MATGLPKFAFIVLLALLSTMQVVFGIRFVIDREDCFSHDIQYEGDTVHVSFVVIKVDGAWHYAQDGIDLVVSSMFLCSNLLVLLSPPFFCFVKCSYGISFPLVHVFSFLLITWYWKAFIFMSS